MTELEVLQEKHRAADAHLKALDEALRESQKRTIQLSAQVTLIRDSAELRLRQATDLIDTLQKRIESMIDEWESQIRGKFSGSDEEKAALLAIVAPFRPKRIGEAAVK